jgi:hypothetical protein
MMWSYPAHFICAPKVIDPEAEATAPVMGYFVVAMIREAPGAIVPMRGPAPITIGFSGEKTRRREF